VGHARGDRLTSPLLEQGVEGRVRLQTKPDGPFEHTKKSPRPVSDLMRALQPGGERLVVERPRGSDHAQAGGELGPVAEGTLDVRPDPLPPSVLRQDPRPVDERRTVPDVLLVQAGELGDPVPSLVLVKAGDRLACQLSLASRR
jgi:hypothetical protein